MSKKQYKKKNRLSVAELKQVRNGSADMLVMFVNCVHDVVACFRMGRYVLFYCERKYFIA